MHTTGLASYDSSLKVFSRIAKILPEIPNRKLFYIYQKTRFLDFSLYPLAKLSSSLVNLKF